MDIGHIMSKRLSEESSSSDTSASADSVNSDSSEVLTAAAADSLRGFNKSALEMDDDEHMEWLLSFPAIANRYSEEDPCFAEDNESACPPLVADYTPRVHNKPGGGGYGQRGGYRGFRHDNYHQRNNGGGQHHNNYNPNRSGGGHQHGHGYRQNRPYHHDGVQHPQHHPYQGPRQGMKRKHEEGMPINCPQQSRQPEFDRPPHNKQQQHFRNQESQQSNQSTLSDSD